MPELADAGQGPALVPELDVADLDVSLSFYQGVLGFSVRFERPQERFAYLELRAAELMLQEATGPGRRFRTAPLDHPYGRGINLQLSVADVDAVHRAATQAGFEPVIPMEERWYDVGTVQLGNRQFVLADPDGYLLRPFTSLGTRLR